MVSSGIFGNASVFDPETSIFPLGNTTGHLGESNPSTSVLISNPSATLSSDFSFSIKTGSLITLGPGSGIFDANKSACTIAKSKLKKELKPEEARLICEKEIKN